ncbi:hypothetical protein Kpho01_40270 [Kitasatospora phosalacinea]|uniref:Uncharacterized protein n=1 Tax=Kitasatospora phosalacinea TaxID=2065 RepID=A0A9W6PJ33_9ACTN|nr:hypothetical protein Kpho01_40270 [Kitasatospora phosalacinea]
MLPAPNTAIRSGSFVRFSDTGGSFDNGVSGTAPRPTARRVPPGRARGYRPVVKGPPAGAVQTRCERRCERGRGTEAVRARGGQVHAG